MAFIKRYAHIDLATNSTQNKLDAAEAYFSGSLYAMGVARFGDTTAFEEELGGHGIAPAPADVVINNRLFVNGETIANDKFSVMGDLSVNSLIDASQTDNKVTVNASAGLQVDNDLDVQNSAFHVSSDGASVAVTLTAKSIMPASDGNFELGSAATQWKTAYVESVVADAFSITENKVMIESSGQVTLDGAGLTVKNGTVNAFNINKAGNLVIRNVNDEELFSVNDALGDAYVKGKLTVDGDLQIKGTTTTIDATTVTIKDLNIELASAAANASQANGAGLSIDGAGKHFTYKNALGAAESDGDTTREAFAIDTNWLPLTSAQYCIGKSDQKWKGLYLSGDAHIGGDVQMDGGDIKSVDHIGAASITATGQGKFASAVVDSGLTVTAGGLTVTAGGLAVTAGASTFGGKATLNAGADVASNSTLTITDGSSLVIASGATATFDAQTTTARVTAGQLTVGGVDLSPIEVKTSTVEGATADLFSFGCGGGWMVKIEMEVIAMSSQGIDGASFKYSLGVMNPSSGEVVIKGIELAKEVFGAHGASLDVDVVSPEAGVFTIKAKGTSTIPKTYWSAQIVKKMKMSSSGEVLEDRI